MRLALRAHATPQPSRGCTIFVTNHVMPPATQPKPKPGNLAQKLTNSVASVALSLALGASSPVIAHADTLLVSSAPSSSSSSSSSAELPSIIDLAHVIPAPRLRGLKQQFAQLERDTGFRLRLISSYSNDESRPSLNQLRRGWHVDDRTVVVLIVPDNPNILSFRFGPEVQQTLSRPFFTELTSRYGNLFYIRENGEVKAVDNAVGTLVGCLRNPSGCAVVPGLTSEHYAATLTCAIAGGLILGSVLRLEPQGFVQRRWVWALVFSPLWATLTINFGLGPVVTRTSDILPIAANLTAAAAAAALVYYYPEAAKATGLTVDDFE